MAQPNPIKLLTDEELDETVEFDITFNNEREVYDIPHLLLKAYVPSLASLLRFPGVRSVKLNNVSHKSFKIFLGWVRWEHFCGTDNSRCPSIKPRQLSELEWDDDLSSDSFDSEESLMWDGSLSSTTEPAEVAIEMFIFANKYEIP